MAERARVERKRRLRRGEYVMLVVSGRVLVQVGGKGSGRRGWMVRSVADDPDEAQRDLQTVLRDYEDQGYERVAWDDELWPEVPADIFEPPDEV